MAMTLYDAFVPSCRQIIGASLGLIARADAHCGEHGIAPAAMIDARLAPDMAALPFQVFSVAHHSAGAIAGVRAGKFAPAAPAGDQDWDSLKTMLSGADAALSAIDPVELDGFAGKPVIFTVGGTDMPFTAENFLLSFSQPNFYFHATALYMILRHKGVTIGKRNFLGMPRIGL